MPRKRKAILAGLWYPQDKRILKTQLDELLELAPAAHGFFEGGVVPHAGLDYSGPGQSEFFKGVNPEVRKLILLAPSHSVALVPDRLYWSGYEVWETPLGDLPGFLDAPRDLGFVSHEDALAREHGLEVIFPFIARCFPKLESLECYLVPRLSGPQEAQFLAELLAQRLPETGGLILGSSDFTHYGRRFGYEPFGPGPSDQVNQAVASSDGAFAQDLTQGTLETCFENWETRRPSICGFFPALLTHLVCRDRGLTGSPGGYYSSQDITGPDSSFVTYQTLLFKKETPRS